MKLIMNTAGLHAIREEGRHGKVVLFTGGGGNWKIPYAKWVAAGKPVSLAVEIGSEKQGALAWR